MESKYNIAVFGLVLVIVASLGVLMFYGGNGVTGYATIGDNTSAYCGYYINESTDLSGDIVGCSGYGLIVNASDIVIDCNGYWINGSNIRVGIDVSEFKNVTVKNCNINGFSVGYSVYSVNDSVFYNNTAFNATNEGFSIDSSSNVSLVNNSAYENDIGFFLIYSNVSLANNSAYRNYAIGLELTDDSVFFLWGNVLFNNAVDFNARGNNFIYNSTNLSFLNPLGGYENSTMIDIYHNVTSVIGSLNISWSPVPVSLPLGYGSFENKFLNFSQDTGTPINSVVWTWSDSESAGYDESRFKLYVLNSSGWFLLNGTPDTVNNGLGYSDLVPSSIYGILTDELLCGASVFSDTNLTGNLTCLGDGLIIKASNVTIDCQNHWITGQGLSTGTGVEISHNNNVTVKNCNIADFRWGMNLYNSTGSFILNNSIFNTTFGAGMSNIDTLNFINNYIYNSADVGINMHYGVNNSVFAGNNFNISTNYLVKLEISGSSSNNTFIGNLFSGGLEGLMVGAGNFTSIINNLFFNNSGNGVYIDTSDNLSLINNTAFNNGEHGFSFYKSNYLNVVNNTAYDNFWNGFGVSSEGKDLYFENNAAYKNNEGFHIDGSSNATFVGNVAYNNSVVGFNIWSSTGFPNILINNRAYNHRSANISDIVVGFGLTGSSGTVLTGNIADNNNGGILLFGGNFYNLSNNTVANNSLYGIGLAISANNYFYSNSITDTKGGYGIWLIDPATFNNSFYNNFVCKNNFTDIYNNFTVESGDDNTCDYVYNWSDLGARNCTNHCPGYVAPRPSMPPAGGNKGGGGVSVNTPPYIAKGMAAEEEGGVPSGTVDFVPTEKPAPQPVVPVVEQKPQPVVEQKKHFNWWPWLILLIIILAIIFLIIKLRKHRKKSK